MSFPIGVQFLYGREEWKWIVAGLLIVWITTIAANWPVRTPGPLTRSERRLAKASRRRRLLWFTIPLLLTLSAITALTLLVVRPGWDTVLILRSRAAEDEPTSGILAPRAALLGSAQLLDLGPVVDDALTNSASVARIFRHFPPQSADLRELDDLLSAILDRVPLRPAISLKQLAPVVPAASQPRITWTREMIESVEISVIRLAARRYHVLEIRVWGGAGRLSRETWDTASAVLKDDGYLLDSMRGSVPMNGVPAISFFSGVNGFRDGMVTGIACVEGEFSSKESVRLTAWIGVEQADPVTFVPVHITVLYDQSNHRLVPFRIDPADPANSADPAVAAALRALFSDVKNHVYITSAPSRLKRDFAPARIRIQPDRNIPLRISGATTGRLVALFTKLGAATDLTSRYFLDQLAEIGIALPRVSSGVSEATLFTQGQWCVIASDLPSAQAALQKMSSKASDDLATWSDDSRRMGPPSLLSWEGLSLPGPLTWSSLPPGVVDMSQRPTAGSTKSTGNAPSAWRIDDEKGRVVVLHADLDALLDLHRGVATIESSFALLRWISWGTTYVTDPAFAEQNGNPPPPPDGGQIAGPAITLRGEELVLRRMTFVCALVAILGLVLLLGWIGWNRWEHTRPRGAQS